MTKNRYATKKEGKTKGYPLWDMEHITGITSYFKENKLWEHYLTFQFMFLFGRRIGDTLDMVWSDIFYENGNMKDEISTLKEQKTGKFNSIFICQYAKDVIKEYLEVTGRNPMNDLNDYIFPYKLKYEWRNRKNDIFYKESLSLKSDADAISIIDEWSRKLGKDISDKRKKTIMEAWKINKIKKNGYNTLGEYLYHEVEYNDISKWHTDKFRIAFNKAVSNCEIPYKVTVHSVRKTFGYYTKLLHPHDILCVETLQEIFGHADRKDTVKYIGLSDERVRQYYKDIGEFLENVENGNYDIKSNTPVVTLKENDLRKIIMMSMETTGEDDITKLNRILDEVGNLKISS